MAKLIAFVFILTAAFVARAETNSPLSIYKDKNQTLVAVISPAALQTLTEMNSSFRIFQGSDYTLPVQLSFEHQGSGMQAPMAVSGDFNGDGQPDLIVMGHDEKFQLVIALLSAPGGKFTTVELARTPYVEPRKTFYPPLDTLATRESQYAEKRQLGLYQYLSLGMKNKSADSVQFETWDGSVRRFLWQNGKLISQRG